ncbi:hypothetical protein LSUE1_G006734 [Lachnellula suecica]|uniref:Heterokaryon incompatibility domain-containing protein n=1 Tax=Lachnellula suecica TaxID=602035 RepID=A0A8T9C564_9HELO|nr:hypothetical protein LSUE1_G006734 [Lachnellula suecica]
MLCESCKCLTIRSLLEAASAYPPGAKTGWNQAGYLILQPSFSSLVSASQNGCENCTLYLRHFSTTFGGSQSVSTRAAELEHDEVIAFLIISNGDSEKGLKHQDAVKEKTLKNFHFRYTEIDHNLGSDSNFDIAKDWIRTCCEEHDANICPPIEDTELPTRLIDVSFNHPKLILSSKGQKARYVVLSHCWGADVKGERLITTTKNISLRRHSIPLSTMPANFLDACIATRKLGYNYLWIDSLCIIQDSREDWETESAKMGDIYMKASFTLAAAAANSSDGGMFETHYEDKDFTDFEPSKWFLVDRKRGNRYELSNDEPHAPAHLREKAHIPLSAVSPETQIVITPWLAFSDLEENWFRCVVSGPLARRGWTLQERTLSRRSLYYGNRQIYWQCASSRLAADGESLPSGAASSIWSRSSDHSEWPDLLSLQQFKHRPLKPTDERRVHQLWRNVLHIYVGRSLTKQSDKLPALAGMAAFVHSITGDDYLAGFWARDISISLLWTAAAIWAKGAATMDYLFPAPQWELAAPTLEAPSWSWAGADVQDRLDFWPTAVENRLWRQNDVKVLNYHMDLAGSNPFGGVKRGTLELSGYSYSRWDGRVKGWNPLEIGLEGLGDALSEYTCLHSSRFDVDRVVLWDYPPRHGVSLLPKLLRLLSQLFFSLLALVVWQGIGMKDRLEKVHDKHCPYCVECLCLHILSSVDTEPRRNLKTGERVFEIGMWALILEPLSGEASIYRRIGICEKIVELSEQEYLEFRDKGLEPPMPEMFGEWTVKTVAII